MGGVPDKSELVSTNQITRLLQAWGSGDERALEQLMPLVYNELHRLAQCYMASEQTGHPLQTTALVHEVYLRLVDVQNVDWQNRAHFYALCARLMRRILIDFARSRNYQKRGGKFAHIELDGKMTLERATLTGGAENDPRAWPLSFPVGGRQADVPYDLRIWIKDGKFFGEINQRIVDSAFAKGAGLTSKRAPYIFILVRMALSGSLKKLTRCVSCHKFKLMPRARAHAYCSRECERMYDSETKRPTKLDQRLASIPKELRAELEMSEAWQKGSEEQKLKLISIVEYRSRLRKIGK
jgi:hypothetical protein